MTVLAILGGSAPPPYIEGVWRAPSDNAVEKAADMTDDALGKRLVRRVVSQFEI